MYSVLYILVEAFETVRKTPWSLIPIRRKPEVIYACAVSKAHLGLAWIDTDHDTDTSNILINLPRYLDEISCLNIDIIIIIILSSLHNKIMQTTEDKQQKTYKNILKALPYEFYCLQNEELGVGSDSQCYGILTHI